MIIKLYCILPMCTSIHFVQEFVTVTKINPSWQKSTISFVIIKQSFRWWNNRTRGETDLSLFHKINQIMNSFITIQNWQEKLFIQKDQTDQSQYRNSEALPNSFLERFNLCCKLDQGFCKNSTWLQRKIICGYTPKY